LSLSTFREFSKRGSSLSGFYTANVWNDLNGAKRLNDWNWLLHR
jgi:hypothetical protein